MQIGIDASRALRGERTGTEYYSLEIIRHLLQLPEANRHDWRLYSDQAILPTHPLLAGISPAVLQKVEVRILPPRRLWTHIALANEVRQNRPDLLFIPAHVLPFVLPPNKLPPSVVTVHDLGYHFFPEAHTPMQRTYLDLSTRWNAWAASRLITVSQATANDLGQVYKVDKAKVRLVYEGTRSLVAEGSSDITRFVLMRPYALYLGTIQPRKNLARMLEAFARIREQVAWDLVLAGKPGWLSASLYELAASLKLTERVHFLGYVSDAEGATLLKEAKFFCFPSLFEGFGLPILEAQSQGTPVMTSTNSSIPEVAGAAALLVDPTDIEAIAAAMLQLSQDEALRQRLIAAGYENVKRFSWEKAARQTMAVLEEAAKSKK